MQLAHFSGQMPIREFQLTGVDWASGDSLRE
jgi:hypothetical protein